MRVIWLQDWHVVPKKRPRVTSRGTYMPPGYKDWQQETALLLRREWQDQPLAGHVAVAVTIYSRTKPRGDLDNLLGAILDAANGVLWGDDRQVTACACRWQQVADKTSMVRVEVGQDGQAAKV